MSGAEIGGGAIPAPPGVTPNLINPVDHTKQNIILHTICLVLITTAITVRLYTRAFITRKLGADDCTSPSANMWATVRLMSCRPGIVFLGGTHCYL